MLTSQLTNFIILLDQAGSENNAFLSQCHILTHACGTCVSENRPNPSYVKRGSVEIWKVMCAVWVTLVLRCYIVTWECRPLKNRNYYNIILQEPLASLTMGASHISKTHRRSRHRLQRTKVRLGQDVKTCLQACHTQDTHVEHPKAVYGKFGLTKSCKPQSTLATLGQWHLFAWHRFEEEQETCKHCLHIFHFHTSHGSSNHAMNPKVRCCIIWLDIEDLSSWDSYLLALCQYSC